MPSSSTARGNAGPAGGPEVAAPSGGASSAGGGMGAGKGGKGADQDADKGGKGGGGAGKGGMGAGKRPEDVGVLEGEWNGMMHEVYQHSDNVWDFTRAIAERAFNKGWHKGHLGLHKPEGGPYGK